MKVSFKREYIIFSLVNFTEFYWNLGNLVMFQLNLERQLSWLELLKVTLDYNSRFILEKYAWKKKNAEYLKEFKKNPHQNVEFLSLSCQIL